MFMLLFSEIFSVLLHNVESKMFNFFPKKLLKIS